MASMFLESSTFHFVNHSQRLLFGSWFLMLVILMNTFVGYMESALMLKEETDRLDTIEQLAHSPKVRPMVFEAAGFLKVIEVTSAPPPFPFSSGDVYALAATVHRGQFHAKDAPRSISISLLTVLAHPGLGNSCCQFTAHNTAHLQSGGIPVSESGLGLCVTRLAEQKTTHNAPLLYLSLHDLCFRRTPR